MTFNPSEPRVPAGSAGGGQWGGGGAPKGEAAKTQTKGGAATQRTGGKSPSSSLGRPRSAAAAKAQQDPKAKALYEKIMGLPKGERAAYVKGLSSVDLEKLTAIAYSSHTSDPDIVHARIAIANEMTKRGIDIKKYGALGGGLTGPRKASPAQMRAVAHAHARAASHRAARSAPTAAGPSSAARAAAEKRQTSQVISATRVRAQ